MMNRTAHAFDLVADAWLEALRRLGRSPKSISTYESTLANLRRFLRKRRVRNVGLVTGADLEDWQQHLLSTHCTTATIGAFTLVVRRWFAWQVSSGQLFHNPARALRTPEFTLPVTRCPTEDQMRRLIRCIKGRSRHALRDRAILETAYATGARLAELAAMDLASIDLKGRSARLFGKGQRERVVPLTRAAVYALSAYLRCARPQFMVGGRSQAALFISARDGERMTTPAFTAVIAKHSRRIGLKYTMHDVRRAFATHLLAGGAHPAAVKEMLGHEGYKHLRNYLRLHPHAALNAVRRFRLFR